MIRVVRGPEPEGLRAERDKRLARAILARRSGQEVDFSGYECVKEQLVKALHYKCAFCERDLRKEGSPVEHFRPKAYVLNDGENLKDTSRYWWLAWTWENLLFACDRCNTSYKKNQFPLKPGTPPLPALSFDTGSEQALLLDPAGVDPRDHIRFCWSKSLNRWIAYPINGSEQGDQTIRTLGLDEDDDLQRHFTKVEPWLKSVERQMKRGDTEDIQATWGHMLESLFAPAQAFHAFTWDVLDERFPEEQRQRWDLTLPRLGRHEAPLASTSPFTDRPELETLPEDLRLRVRAVPYRAPWAEVQSVFAEVSCLGPWSEAHLAAVFEREVSTIRDWQQRMNP